MRGVTPSYEVRGVTPTDANRFFKLTVGAFRTDFSEFQGQNFKVGGTLEAELVCFYIQARGK